MDRNTLFQVSLLQGLVSGDFHGSVTIGELRCHGDIGIGTFDGMNGELIMLDGAVYRASGDGSVRIVSDVETTPFAVVATAGADFTDSACDIPDYEALLGLLERRVSGEGKNRFYMVRIDGTFSAVNVRSVYAQSEPYKTLVEVLECDQTFFDYEDIEGTAIGLYCPPYMSSLNAEGWHFHFISKDRTRGGHVLGIKIADATVSWSDIDSFELWLPKNETFSSLDLKKDRSEEIKKIETNK